MSETMVVGKKGVAAHFNVSERTVLNWERAGMPGRSGRTYDLVKIQIWRDHKEGRGGGATPVKDSYRLNGARITRMSG